MFPGRLRLEHPSIAQESEPQPGIVGLHLQRTGLSRGGTYGAMAPGSGTWMDPAHGGLMEAHSA